MTSAHSHTPTATPTETPRVRWFECDDLIGYSFDEYDGAGIAVFRHPTRSCATVDVFTGFIVVGPND